MGVHLEVWARGDTQLVPVQSERITVGSEAGNDVVLVQDKSVSRLHAAVERLGPGWCVRDLGSRNGTYVNGQRVLGERALRHGDEIRVGRTRMIFRTDSPARVTATEGVESPPELTRREREVLEALCTPVAEGDVFTDPATIKEIAEALVVTEAAVKQHLSRLYQKFELYDDSADRRRVRLANEAIRRGAVNLSEVRARGSGDEPAPR